MAPRGRMLGGVIAAVLSLCAAQVSLSAAPKAPRRQAPARPAARASVATARPAPPAVKSSRQAKANSNASAAARRRARARSRAAERAREAKELETPRFKVDEAGREVPAPRAAAAIVLDPATNEILFEENGSALRSIASITKVMTALVVLESLTDLEDEVTVERADVARASTTYLRHGYSVSVDELLHLLLIGSDNAAARVLARISPYGSEGFVARMNAKARELGLTRTQYEDPSGLYAGNISSAFDQARLMAYAVADARISSEMRKAEFDFVPGKRTVHVGSTNRFVKSGEIEVLGGKTGFISSSGYCLATLVRLPQSGRQLALVVLGARSNAARFAETKHLVNWLSADHAVAAGAPDGSQQQQN